MSVGVEKHVVIIVDSLAIGGAEKAAGVLSKLLYNDNYKVTIISLKDQIVYPYKGNLINLGVGHSSIKVVKQVQKFFKLKKSISKHKDAVIIDFRMRNRAFMEFLMHCFIWPKHKMIYVVQNYQVDWHLPKGSIFKWFYKKGLIVAVSKDIKKLLNGTYGFNNVIVIPNVIDLKKTIELGYSNDIPGLNDEKYIISIGRLTNYTKQHDKLISAYAQSKLPLQNVKLFILGIGPDKDKLEHLISQLDLNNKVKLIGFQENPYAYIKNSQFKVLCSRVEGFPLSILEALALNTPVVSFNCKSGPSEIIEHNVNGVLVEGQNFDKLRKVMDYLIENPTVLNQMKSNTTNNLSDYSEDKHLESWRQILK